MILITITPTPAGDHLAEANVCGVRYQARSTVPQSAVRNVLEQLAHQQDDQEVLIQWPTIVARHRSLWRLAGINTRDDQQRFCPACNARVTEPGKVYCGNKCRVRASRARSKKECA